MKKYRSIDGSDKRLALSSGQITLVGAEWKELPDMFRNEALANGCLDEDMAKGIAAPTQVNRPEKIREILTAMVEDDNDGDFNADGSPNMHKVKELCGFAATKEEVSGVWTAMMADALADGGDE